MKKCCPKLPIAFLLVFILGAFFYYQYSFTAVSKVNFQDDTFYFYENGAVDLFIPKDLEYQLCFYNSFAPESKAFLEQNFRDSKGKILAVDFYQQGKGEMKEVLGDRFIEVRIPSSLMLKLVHTFALKALPHCFVLRQNKDNTREYQHLKEFGFYKLVNFKENQ